MQGFQSILFDLLANEPSKVYATGYDLYTKPSPYKTGYINASQNMLYDLGRHDVVGNYRYLVMLYNLGLFEGDSNLQNILTMSEVEYLQKIQEVSSEW
jgi:hypothetical protein